MLICIPRPGDYDPPAPRLTLLQGRRFSSAGFATSAAARANCPNQKCPMCRHGVNHGPDHHARSPATRRLRRGGTRRGSCGRVYSLFPGACRTRPGGPTGSLATTASKSGPNRQAPRGDGLAARIVAGDVSAATCTPRHCTRRRSRRPGTRSPTTAGRPSRSRARLPRLDPSP